jgi:sortase (surface protein transpeptidase)
MLPAILYRRSLAHRSMILLVTGCALSIVIALTSCGGTPPVPVADGLRPTSLPKTSIVTSTPTATAPQPTPSLASASAQARPIESTRTRVPTSTATPTPSVQAPFARLTALALTPTRPRDPPKRPAQLTIPSIGLNAPVLPVDLDRDGNPIVLKHDVAWYDRTGKPSEGTNIVFWAHVLRFKDAPNIPAPFARVEELQRGARISVADAGGKRYNYVVIAQIRVRPDQVEYLAPTSLERVTLISCTGRSIIVNGEVVNMTERLVTIAEPIS